MDLFSVNTILITILGYPLSYIEFFGTILNLWSVWLVMKDRVLNWPIGIIGSILFGVLFYQVQLYSDLLVQVYYVITGFWGWWVWLHPKAQEKSSKNDLKISFNSANTNLYYIIAIILGTYGLGYLMAHIHLLLPTLFPKPATFAFADAFVTTMSFAAQILMAKKKVESWYLWILVDIISIYLYIKKQILFVMLLYITFLILAVSGLINWRKLYLQYQEEEND